MCAGMRAHAPMCIGTHVLLHIHGCVCAHTRARAYVCVCVGQKWMSALVLGHSPCVALHVTC